MTTGEKIRDLRKQAGISQNNLAKQMFVSRQSVSKWERNENMPDIVKLTQISEFFDVTVDFLLKNPTTPPQKPALVNSQNPPTAKALIFSGKRHLCELCGKNPAKAG
ncbi:MAG: helix-turn-helix domain-containing protein [Defluviitaleaceae bacterium]|nr:helix-turn-helix domain-containing protein [Defluviitaleaceae bacterium]